MTDQLEVLALVTSALDAAGIPYMVTGSMASGYYGEPRMTRDVDLVVELRADDPDRLEALLGESFLLTGDGVREAMRRRTMFYAIHKDALVNVGFGVRREETFRVEEFGRRRRVTLDGHAMWYLPRRLHASRARPHRRLHPAARITRAAPGTSQVALARVR